MLSIAHFAKQIYQLLYIYYIYIILSLDKQNKGKNNHIEQSNII